MSTRVTQVQFQVRGGGQFPFDMLRYDSCYPASETDSAALEHHRREKRRVTLLASIPNPQSVYFPDRARWGSFGWTVVDGSRREVG